MWQAGPITKYILLLGLSLSLGCGACGGNPDKDGDGYQPAEGDCDDFDDDIYPGAAEIAYDGIDQDCNGSDLTDRDEDGYDAEVVGGEDCDDDDSSIYPGAPEVSNDGIDQDCDGEDAIDADEDGYTQELDCDDSRADVYPGREPGVEELDVDHDCDGDIDNDGFIEGDCYPNDPEAYPQATETAYDGIDQDCDGFDLTDVDNDGFPGGEGGTDCDDGEQSINPGAIEIPYDGIDQNCDLVDLTDVDEDGVDGGVGGEDCNDEDPNISPLAEEIAYDGIDQNCDGSDGVDPDGDGFCADEASPDDERCPGGSGDCDEYDDGTHPGAIDYVDGVDNDCQSDLEDGVSVVTNSALYLEGASNGFGFGAWSGSGDINGDGIDDLLVSSCGDGSELTEGLLSIWLGPLEAWYAEDVAPNVVLRLPAGSNLGREAEVLDLNGDGVQDLALGAPSAGGFEAGAVYVLFGRDGVGEIEALNNAPLTGVADVHLVPAGDHFIQLGASLAGGDLNQDGVDDLIVGAPSSLEFDTNGEGGTQAGSAYVIYGSRAEDAWSQGSHCIDRAAWTTDASCEDTVLPEVESLPVRVERCLGSYFSGRFGQSVESGDLDGDGLEDLVVSGSSLTAKSSPAKLYFWFSSLQEGFDFCGDSEAIADAESGLYVVDGGGGNGALYPILGTQVVTDVGADPTGVTPQSALAVVALNGSGNSNPTINQSTLYLLRFRQNSLWPTRLQGGEGGLTVVSAPSEWTGPIAFATYGEGELFSVPEPLRLSVTVGDLTGDGLGELIVGSPYLMDDEGLIEGGAIHIFIGDGPQNWPPTLALDEADALLLGEPGTFVGDSVSTQNLDGAGSSELMVGSPGLGLADDLGGRLNVYWGVGQSE